jgi:hypothetical protein
VDGKLVRKEKDHDQIIGYDDINQLFWYPEGISRIVLTDNVSSNVLLTCYIINSTTRHASSMYRRHNDI